jgi:hypothetical protein
MPSYRDPTIDDTQRELWEITQAAIIEWLRKGGNFTMPVKTRKTSLQRWLKDHLLTVLVVTTAVCLVSGMGLGWALRILSRG